MVFRLNIQKQKTFSVRFELFKDRFAI